MQVNNKDKCICYENKQNILAVKLSSPTDLPNFVSFRMQRKSNLRFHSQLLSLL